MAEHNDEIRKFMGKIYRILSVIDDNIIQEIQTFSVLRMGLCLCIRSRKPYNADLEAIEVIDLIRLEYKIAILIRDVRGD